MLIRVSVRQASTIKSDVCEHSLCWKQRTNPSQKGACPLGPSEAVFPGGLQLALVGREGRVWKSKTQETWTREEEYLFDHRILCASPSRVSGGCEAASLFLGLLTSHHVPLGHIEGRRVTICIGGVFKQDRIVILGLQ